jgi:hypothetical protein
MLRYRGATLRSLPKSAQRCPFSDSTGGEVEAYFFAFWEVWRYDPDA